jgi:hypothetical protein
MKLKAHKIYLFTLKNGKKKLGHGDNPEHALKILSYRLTPEEMAEITTDPPEVIRQTDLQKYVKELG